MPALPRWHGALFLIPLLLNYAMVEVRDFVLPMGDLWYGGCFACLLLSAPAY